MSMVSYGNMQECRVAELCKEYASSTHLSRQQALVVKRSSAPVCVSELGSRFDTFGRI